MTALDVNWQMIEEEVTQKKEWEAGVGWGGGGNIGYIAE